jgi:hypothetical protein
MIQIIPVLQSGKWGWPVVITPCALCLSIGFEKFPGKSAQKFPVDR